MIYSIIENNKINYSSNGFNDAISNMKNSINDVMVSMLALGAVDRGLEPW
jgi:hypothetical protein